MSKLDRPSLTSGSAPNLGDRVAYVIVKGIKGAAAYEKSEDPLYVLENNVPIDTKYYLDNQLSKPLMRIFEPILGEKANGLCETRHRTPSDPAVSGEHTRTIQIATPTIGGLMKFAVKTVTCLGCRTPLRGKGGLHLLHAQQTSWPESAVCANCRSKLPDLYQKQVSLRRRETRRNLIRRSHRHPPFKLTSPVCGRNASDVKALYIRFAVDFS